MGISGQASVVYLLLDYKWNGKWNEIRWIWRITKCCWHTTARLKMSSFINRVFQLAKVGNEMQVTACTFITVRKASCQYWLGKVYLQPLVVQSDYWAQSVTNGNQGHCQCSDSIVPICAYRRNFKSWSLKF